MIKFRESSNIKVFTKIFSHVYKGWEYDGIEYNLKCLLENDYSIGIIASLDNKDVGMIILNIYYFENYRYGQLDEICVLPEYNDKNIGTALINRAVELINDNYGNIVICLEHTSNSKLNHFYEKNKFKNATDRKIKYRVF